MTSRMDRTAAIDCVEILPIRVPNRVPLKLANSLLAYQSNVIVRVWAGDAWGLGETEPLEGFEGCHETQGTICAVLRERFAPQLMGESPLDIERIAMKLASAVEGNPYATAAAMNAIYDLAARMLDVPLCQLLGGRLRSRLPVVWTIGIKDTTDEAVSEAREAVERGYRHLKLKVGGRDEAQDVAAVTAIRQAVGCAVGLRVDANAALSFPQALSLLSKLKPLRLDLAEQPLGIHDLEGACRLIELVGIPVMPDESLHSPASALALVKARAASIFGMKLAKHGGIHNARKIAAIAHAAGLPIYPGNQPSTSVGSATAAHFFAALSNATLAGDFHVGPAGWLADDVVLKPLVVADGHAQLPVGPGIGMTLDPYKMAAYAHEP